MDNPTLLAEACEGFSPCPLCHQWSHSLGTDEIAEALLHFESMDAHPVRGHPMGHHFDEQTRDMAQVLVAAARGVGLNEALARVGVLEEALGWYADPKNWWVRNTQQRGYHRMGEGSMERHAGQPGRVTQKDDVLMAGQFMPDAGDRARAALPFEGANNGG